MISAPGSKAEAEGWVDGLLLCAHIASIKQVITLQQALKQPESDQGFDLIQKEEQMQSS